MYAKGVLQIRRRSRTNEPLSICPAQYIITVNAEEYASTPAPALHTCFPKLHREVCFNQSDRYSHIIGSQAQQHHSLLGPRYLCAWAAPPPRRNAHILEPPNRVRSFSAAQHASIYQLSSSPPLPSPANSPSSAPLPSIMVINHHHARLGHAQFLFARSLALFEIHVGCMQELF